MDIEPTLVAEPDSSSADSLVSENEPDDMANEQTWPTEDEMNDFSGDREDLPDAPSGTTPKIVKRIPKGTSEYQAAWIVDESDEDDANDEDRDVSDHGMEEEEEEEEMVDMPMEEDTEMDIESRQGVAFQDLDNEEESKQ